MQVIVKKPGDKLRIQNVKNTYFDFFKVIGGTFTVLPINDVNVYMSADMKGEKNFKINNVDVCGTVIITGATSDGIETDIRLKHFDTVMCLVY